MKFTESESDETSTERPQQRRKILGCEFLTALMIIESLISKDIEEADGNNNVDFVAILNERLKRVRSQIEALFS